MKKPTPPKKQSKTKISVEHIVKADIRPEKAKIPIKKKDL
jgi:hypothetical protein